MGSICRTWCCGLLLALVGCAQAPQRAELPAQLFDDARFAPAPSVGRDEVFALSPELQDFLRDEVMPQVRRNGSRMGLYLALRDSPRVRLEYDAGQTRTAAQAYAAGAGNCLSLVLLTAALAQALDIDVSFQEVEIAELWSRSREFVVLSGHVNLSLRANLVQRTQMVSSDALVIDFIPIRDGQRLRVRPLSEARVLAMFFNNRAVEAMENAQLDQAYAHLRAALRHDPGYVNALNSLAVLYRRHGDFDLAERSLGWLLEQQPGNLPALANLGLLLRQQGRPAEAEQVEARLRLLQPRAPFVDYERGLAAARNGDWPQARAAFERELELTSNFHELHFWLGQAYYRLGDRRRAAEHLERAQEEASTPEQRRRYTRKLEALKGLALRG